MHYAVAFEKYDYEGRVGEKKKSVAWSFGVLKLFSSFEKAKSFEHKQKCTGVPSVQIGVLHKPF